ncbi:hypothetical protein WDU94_007932 [Cyamophila willieti]
MSAGQQTTSDSSTLKMSDPSNEENFNVQVDLIGQTPDDSELIDAYERAVKLAKQKIIQNRPDLQELESEDGKTPNENSNQNVNNANKFNKSKKKKGKNNKSKWSRGKNCRAVFLEDNKEYEAIICHLSPEQDECVVKFVGYGNKETVPLSSIKPSHGPDAVLDQKFRASNCAGSTASELNESFYSPSSTTCGDSARFIPFDSSRLDNSLPANMAMPPLPPPAFLAGQPLDSTETLSAVLMAWYMAGYHTGRYEASIGLNKNKPYGRL